MPGRGPIFVTGGTGFVGTAIQKALKGNPLRLLVREGEVGPRNPDARYLPGDVTDAASLAGTMEACSTVIHLVAIIQEHDEVTFDRVIRQGTENVVAEAERAGVEHFILMSAMGARNDPRYPYFFAKHRAEEAAKSSVLPWTIFRPSIIFGPGDGFINQLADLVRSAPVVPIAGNGQSLFQPVSVHEVATSFAWAVGHPESIGQTYELGGPDILTYDEIIELIQNQLGTSKRTAHLPASLVRAAVRLASPLPKRLRPPVTLDQLRMLEIDNCTDRSATPDLAGRPQLRVQNGIGYLTSCVLRRRSRVRFFGMRRVPAPRPDGPLPRLRRCPMMP
jgi:uncharacterized protein YbjT (DUF2867 family)